MHDYIIVLVPSLVAIIIMVVLIKMTRLEHLVRFDDEAPVRDTMDAHFEGQAIERIVLSEDQQSALVFMQNGAPPVLVRAFGDRMVVRVLAPKAIKDLSGEDTQLSIALNDFTWPRTKIIFANAAARTNAQSLISTSADHSKEASSHA